MLNIFVPDINLCPNSKECRVCFSICYNTAVISREYPLGKIQYFIKCFIALNGYVREDGLLLIKQSYSSAAVYMIWLTQILSI